MYVRSGKVSFQVHCKRSSNVHYFRIAIPSVAPISEQTNDPTTPPDLTLNSTSAPLQGKSSTYTDQLLQQLFACTDNFEDHRLTPPARLATELQLHTETDARSDFMEADQLQSYRRDTISSAEQGPYTDKEFSSPTYLRINLDENIATSTPMRSCGQGEIGSRHKRLRLSL